MTRKELREAIEKRQGKTCYYCEIPENEFIPLWGIFYKKTRGYRLEIDRTDNNNREYTMDNCVLACAICNNAKSNKFTEKEFKKVGEIIKKIWKKRKKQI